MDNADSKTYTCRRSNMKGWEKIFGLVVFAFVIFSVVYQQISPIGPWENKTKVTLAVVGISLLLLFPSLFRLMTKIQISEDGIVCRTPINSVVFSWNEIRYTGLYYTSEHYIDEIDSDQAREYVEQGYRSVVIWISISEAVYFSQPVFPLKHSLSFDFDEEAWKLIQHYRRH